MELHLCSVLKKLKYLQHIHNTIKYWYRLCCWFPINKWIMNPWYVSLKTAKYVKQNHTTCFGNVSWIYLLLRTEKKSTTIPDSIWVVKNYRGLLFVKKTFANFKIFGYFWRGENNISIIFWQIIPKIIDFDDINFGKWNWLENIKNFADIRDTFATVSQVGGQHYVFNIKGNDYRLVVVIKFTPKTVYIRFVGTHTEYDKIQDIEKL